MKRRSQPPPPPLVTATRQAWKVTAGVGGMVVAAIAGFVQLFGPGDLKQAAVLVIAAAAFVAFIALWSVRCPACGRSLGVWAARNGSLTTWHEQLTTVAACPHCGHAAPRA